MNFEVHAEVNLPLAQNSRPWSASQATANVFAWAKDSKTKGIDYEKAKRAFLIVDKDNLHSEDGYLLPFADVVNGKLMAVPNGIREAFKALIRNMVPQGVDQVTVDLARRVLDSYFARMPKPFGDSGKKLRIDGSIKFAMRSDEAGVLIAEETPQGFLRIAPSKLARDGTLVYSDGSEEWNEFRPAEELSKSASSFSLVPLTDDHPPEMVDAANVRHWQAGTVGEVRVEIWEGVTYLVAPLLITDPGLIRRALDGETQELSIGFLARVWEKSGATQDGTKYKYVQTDLEGNHVAVVEEGRAGPICALASFGDSAWQIAEHRSHSTGDFEMPQLKSSKQDMPQPAPAAPAAPAPAAPAAPAASAAPAEGGEQPAAAPSAPEMETVEVPGAGPVEMSKTLATVVKALLAMLPQTPAAQPAQPAAPAAPAPAAPPAGDKADGDEEEMDVKDEDDKKDEDDMDKKDSAEIARLKGKIDGLEATLATEHERFDARAQLLTDAAAVLGPDANIKGLSREKIMTKVIVHVDGEGALEQLKDATKEYIEGRYDAALAVFKTRSKADDVDLDDFRYDSADEDSLEKVMADSNSSFSTAWRGTRPEAN